MYWLRWLAELLGWVILVGCLTWILAAIVVHIRHRILRTHTNVDRRVRISYHLHALFINGPCQLLNRIKWHVNGIRREYHHPDHANR